MLGSHQVAAPVLEIPTSDSPFHLMSLDVFRGATIGAMLLVNDPGDEQTVFSPLRHSAWNGCTPTDLIFPFFLFIVGVSMAFSLASRLRHDPSRTAALQHVLWRGLALFGIGLLFNGAILKFNPATWRIYGVLERIAIVYVVCAIAALWTRRNVWIGIVIGCLVGYWVLMRYVPVPGVGIPTHGFALLDPDRNLAAWLDRELLTGHLYNGTRDPEGLLSTIPAIATTLLGVLTGNWLRSEQPGGMKAAAMAVAGVIFVAAGEFFSIWFPINKQLWTSSYVLFTAGIALLALAASYALLDVWKWRGGWAVPFLVFGRNAIAAYVLGSVLAIAMYWLPIGDRSVQEFLYQEVFAPLAPPPMASLLYAVWFVMVCWAAMGLLYRKGVFLKI
jgi:predicted acyltransferase